MTSFGTLYDYCMNKPGAEETYPFDEVTLVFKVGGKMFGLIGTEHIPSRINLKCDPERSVELRERYDGIEPGYHMHKKHWNTVDCDGRVPEPLILELIDHSYELVVASLPRKVREEIESAESAD